MDRSWKVFCPDCGGQAEEGNRDGRYFFHCSSCEEEFCQRLVEHHYSQGTQVYWDHQGIFKEAAARGDLQVIISRDFEAKIHHGGADHLLIYGWRNERYQVNAYTYIWVRDTGEKVTITRAELLAFIQDWKGQASKITGWHRLRRVLECYGPARTMIVLLMVSMLGACTTTDGSDINLKRSGAIAGAVGVDGLLAAGARGASVARAMGLLPVGSAGFRLERTLRGLGRL